MEEGDGLREGDPCPRCGGTLVLRHSPRGDFLGCSEYPACDFFLPLATGRGVEALMDLATPCPRCGGLLQVKRGRYGMFIGCANYPECDYTVQRQAQSGIPCPVCGQGEMALRTSRRGRVFYGCSRFPACDYTVPGEPCADPCPICSFPLRYVRPGDERRRLVCGNPLCPTRRRRRAAAGQQEKEK
ncbi:MAG: topoisomerase DNA-binding C4 zinc finger domain-containing protein [Succinivibrionaceae bacterium]|nr:topoisomerase DNA-binding C4 zinc finger domain-containing protein [Succinivibrionaceae bacterium]